MDYTSLRCTERLAEAAEYVGSNERISSDLRKWKEAGDRTTIPFSLVRNIHAVPLEDAKATRSRELFRFCCLALAVSIALVVQVKNVSHIFMNC